VAGHVKVGWFQHAPNSFAMTRFYNTIDHYFEGEPSVSVQSLKLNGLLVSSLDESSNDISIASTGTHSLLLSVTGSTHHRVRIGDKVCEAPTKPGDISLIPAGIDLHSSWTTSGDKLKTITVEFDSSLFRMFAPEIFNAKFSNGHLVPSNYSRRPELASLALLFRRELDGSTRAGKLFTDTLTRLFAIEISSNAWSVSSTMPSHGDRPDFRVGKAIDYIEANFFNDISLLDMADAAGLGLTHFLTRFRCQTGMTPYSYVINRRIGYATLLLRTTDMPITQIALEAGFSDQQHLTRVMRARKGQTPKSVRFIK
jgi:AraC family transcriptional regulator